MIDVLVQHEPDGGQMYVTDPGLVQLTSGIESAVVLSLDGGNEDDDGSATTESEQWWGNLDETGDVVLRSDMPAKLRALPQTSANVQALVSAAERALQWLLDQGLVRELRVVPRVSVRRIDLSVETDLGTVVVPLSWAG